MHRLIVQLSHDQNGTTDQQVDNQLLMLMEFDILITDIY